MKKEQLVKVRMKFKGLGERKKTDRKKRGNERSRLTEREKEKEKERERSFTSNCNQKTCLDWRIGFACFVFFQKQMSLL